MSRLLQIGNGTVLVNFDHLYQLRDIYFPHPGKENHTVGHESKFGVYCDGQMSWISHDSNWTRRLRYMDRTLVTEVVLVNESLGLEIQVQDAVDFHLWVLVRRVQVRDLSGRQRNARLFFHHDFHIMENDVGDTAYFDPQTNSVIHYKDDRWFLIGLTTDRGHVIDQYACGQKETDGKDGTWRDCDDGVLSMNAIAQGSVDSVVSVALELVPKGLSSAYMSMCFGFSYDKVARLHNIVREKSAAELLTRTASYWRLWIDCKRHDLSQLPEPIARLFERSLLLVRTHVDDSGAIVAGTDYDITSFGHDTYAYVWPRDGALVALALSRAGYVQSAQQFFQFCLSVIGEKGYLMHKYNPDGELASSWHPWMVDGRERLPIQEDETALVVYALWQHFKDHSDVEFIKPLYRRLIVNTADFMSTYIDAATGLPRPSYDLWEERWGVHMFTVAAVIGALDAAAHFARAFGQEDASARYLAARQRMRQAMIDHMWDPESGRFARMVSLADDGTVQKDMTVDSAMYAVFAFGALPADDPMVAGTMSAIEEHLTVKTDCGGIARYQDDYYQRVSKDVPGNPWFICSLWLAQYRIALGGQENLERARAVLDWVASRAPESGLLAEQLDPYSSQGLSVSPLTWSHATFVMCVMDYLYATQEQTQPESCAGAGR